MTIRLAALVVLFQFANIAPVPVPAPGNVEGRVLRTGTREPLGDVRVALYSTARSDADPSRVATWSVTTDGQGTFVFKNLSPGTYRLTFSANRYVRQEYGQRTFPGSGTPIIVAPGQTLKDLITELTPTGAVSGTIRDNDKRPMAGVPVRLMRASYDLTGERQLRVSGTEGRTDDRGEFRLSFVTPGSYYLSAGTHLGPEPFDIDPRGNEVRETFNHVYYPGVEDLQFAMPMVIEPGVATTVTDLTLKKVTGVRVSGRIIDATTGQPPEKPQILLAYYDPGFSMEYSVDSARGETAAYNKDGTFEYRGVLPGTYGLLVMVDIPGQPTPPPGTKPLQRFGHVPLEVGTTNVEGVVVTASPATFITGRVRVEGQENWKSAFQNVTWTIGVTLEPSSSGALPPVPGRPWPNSGSLESNGAFRVENVMPGEYRFELFGLRPTFYFKEARFGAMDLLSQPFQFTGKEQGSLEIVLDSKVGSVEGVITNRLAVASGAQVVLVPDKGRHRVDQFRSVTTDKDGHFRITNIPPGDYKLYAWEAIEQYRWFDPDILKAAEQFASPVHLTESSNKTIDARLIPASLR